MAAIRALKTGITKFAPADHLTPLHALLAQVALLSKNYKAALPILDRDVVEIEPAVTHPHLPLFLPPYPLINLPHLSFPIFFTENCSAAS